MASPGDLERMSAAIDAAPLAEASRKTYKVQLRAIEGVTGRPVGWSLAHPEQAWKLLQAHRRADGSALSAQTLKACTNALTAVLKYHAESARRYPDAQERWRAIMKGAIEVVDQKYMEQRASDRQQEQHVPWAELVRKREALLRADPASADGLVLALHTMMPPLRADLGAVRIFRPPRAPPPEPGSAAERATPNYLVVRAPRRGEPLPRMRLVLTEYKTASRFGRQEEQLPEELVEVVVVSLRARPRDWLVVTPRGAPFSSGQTYSNHVREVLQRAFGRPCGGVNMIRHSFANMLVDLDLTPAMKQIFARKMGHTVGMHEKYRLRLDEPAAEFSAESSAESSASALKDPNRCRLRCEVRCGEPQPPVTTKQRQTGGASQQLSTVRDAYRAVLGMTLNVVD